MDGGAQMSGIQTDDVPTDVTGGAAPIVTADFTSNDEGQLSVGRFTLHLHKNTLQMPAKITMRVTDEDAMEVQVEVSPAEANDFQVPAQLTADLSDQPETDYRRTTMFYWEHGIWEPSKAVAPHPNKQVLVAHMKELSNCRVAEEVNQGESAKAR
jgi:hypothetical protein